MKKYLLLLLSLTLLAACAKDDDPVVEESHLTNRTVLVYVAAENNLEPFLDEDIEEMKTGSLQLGEDQNLVLYVNRADSNSTPYMARVLRGELVDTVFMPEALASDPAVLSGVLRKTLERYPAQSYGLVLWGHCTEWDILVDTISATKAYGGSIGDNTSDTPGKYWMNIPDMNEAIIAGMDGKKLAFIFGDCCNFICIEIAYELRNVTDYIIGSPAEIPDRGAPYNLCVADFFLESADFYRQLIDHYYDCWIEMYNERPNHYSGKLSGYSVPLSVVKTSQLDKLASATSDLLGTIADKVSSTGGLNLNGVLFYYSYGMYKSFSYDMKNILKYNAATEDFNTWMNFYEQAIPYARHSAKWMANCTLVRWDMDDFVDIPSADCGSIGMFFPDSIYIESKYDWNNTIRQFQWNDVVHWEQYGW